MKYEWTLIGALVFALIVGCSGELSGSDPRSDSDSAVPETKRIERLTADQFFRSLEVTTGQRWSRAADFEGTLGKPDFDEVVQGSTDISVSFVKLAGDAAREVCQRAVDADLETADTGERIILRDLATLDPMDDSVTRNLRYLILRFHGIHITDDLDSRLEPWMSLLRTDLPTVPEEREGQGPDRWKAVCVGLISHPDFLTY